MKLVKLAKLGETSERREHVLQENLHSFAEQIFLRGGGWGGQLELNGLLHLFAIFCQFNF